MQKKWPIIYLFSDDFGLRSPVIIQKQFQMKTATSIECFFDSPPQFSTYFFNEKLAENRFFEPTHQCISTTNCATCAPYFSPYVFHGSTRHQHFFFCRLFINWQRGKTTNTLPCYHQILACVFLKDAAPHLTTIGASFFLFL